MCPKVLILFKMENANEVGSVHLPTILDCANNPPKIIAEENYEGC